MKEMTIRERMLAVYNNKLPDRIPVGTYPRYIPSGSWERELRNMGIGFIESSSMVSFLAPSWYTSQGYISEVKGAEIDIKYLWKDGVFYERVSYITPVGTVYEESNQAAGLGSKCISKYFISSLEDYKIVQYLVENTIYRKNDEAVKLKINNVGEDGVVLGRLERSPYQKILIELAGAEQFLVDLYSGLEPVIELLEVMESKMDEAFRMSLDSPVDVFWQPDNITSALTPPNMFKKYHLPFYQKRSRQIKEAGKPYINHMDGHTKALKDLINQSGFDCIESLSFPCIGGDYTFSEAKEAFPGKVFLPNFPGNLSTRSNEEIEEFLRSLLDEAGKTPFMLQISEDIPLNEIKRVLYTICKFMKENGQELRH